MPPPDDFAKTSPNVDFSNDELADWEKTQINKPSDAPADDWGKTVINYNNSEKEHEEEVSNTQYNTNINPSEPEWGMTQAGINVGRDNHDDDADFDIESDGATVPYFRLPEADRKKYEKLDPTPTEKARKEEEDKKSNGGIPIWFWISAGIMTLFSLAVLVLLAIIMIINTSTGFTVKIIGAERGSEALVDGTKWGISDSEGNIPLKALDKGIRTITVRRKGFKDFEKSITGEHGETIPMPVIQIRAERECDKGEIDLKSVTQRESCANTILDNMTQPPNLDDLLRALNLYYINFASGDHSVPNERRRFIQRASTYLKQIPADKVIEIGGHTDNKGNKDKNQDLSERRAEAVKKVLEGYGIDGEKTVKLVTKGYADNDPVATNDTESGRFQNRRIGYKLKP